MDIRLEMQLPVRRGSVSGAREALEGLSAKLDERLFQDLRLLLTELVTNCIRHAGLSPDDAVRVTIDIGPARARVEVSDDGVGFDGDRLAAVSESESGRDGWGLFLVDKIAQRWGVDRNGSSQTVWFEIDAASAPVAAGRGVV